MSTAALVISSAASAQAAAAQHAARIAHCEIVVSNFDNKTASVQETKEFSRCFIDLYPDPLSASSTIFFKIIFIIALISGIAGSYIFNKKGYWYSNGDFMDYVMCFFLFFISVPIGIFVVMGIGYGIAWACGFA